MCDRPITVGKIHEEAVAAFEQAELYFGHGTETAWDEAAWMITHVLNLSTQSGQLELDLQLSLDQAQHIRELIDQRIQTRKPMAYLINSAWFCGLEFFVDERVIVPRSPIAELIGNEFSPWVNKAPAQILDLCTGSGCIAIACADQFPEAQVDAADIGEECLMVANINVKRHGLDARVKCIKADIFDGVPTKKYDLIVCNPPYVDASDMAVLPREYQHEPEMALASGDDGLDIVRRVLQEAGNFLAVDAVLVCEVGNSEEALCQAFPFMPFIWLEFEYGGHGVFLLTAKELSAYWQQYS